MYISLILFIEFMRKSGFFTQLLTTLFGQEREEDSETVSQDLAPQCAVNKEHHLDNPHFEKMAKLFDECTSPQQFYRCQMMHTPGQTQDIKRVGIIFKSLQNHEWINSMRQAIQQINYAAPGLLLIEVKKGSEQDVNISILQKAKQGCYTWSNIHKDPNPYIVVQTKWSGSKIGTSIHELMHALGFMHQHQRRDGGNYYELIEQNPTQTFKDNYGTNQKVRGLSTFDPYSIMCYSQGKKMVRTDAEIWALKLKKERSQRLSQLDKVGLNILFPPCVSQRYKPVKSNITGMFYCGRNVMINHNIPAKSLTDGFCGLNNGANCPACRVIVNPEFSDRIGKQKWQGWSGLVYCGQKCDEEISRIHGHNGICGPNNGRPCKTCKSFLCD